MLFYRGFWCPFCKAQLKSFQGGREKLAAEGIGVLAASVDPLDKAKGGNSGIGLASAKTFVREGAKVVIAGRDKKTLKSMAEGMQQRVPMKRMGRSEELAMAALFLASDDSSFMLGAEVAVDGGTGQL